MRVWLQIIILPFPRKLTKLLSEENVGRLEWYESIPYIDAAIMSWKAFCF